MFIFARLNKIHGALLALVMIIQPSLHATERAPMNMQERDRIPKPWTMLVYMARDNDLSDFGTHNINQMMAVANPHVNILVYDCHNFNGKKVAQKLLITNQKVTVLSTTLDVDSGNEETFTNACLWALQEYPCEKFAVIAWNHGSGMLNRYPFGCDYLKRGFCYDDTTGNYLDDIKLMRSLEKVVKFRKGKKVEIFGFDACLMADIELVAALAPYALYTVASQENIPGEGWDYTALLSWMGTEPLTPVAFAKQIVVTYANYYRTSGYAYTLSAINNALFAQLNTAINKLSERLCAAMKSKYGTTVRKAVTKSINSYFDEATYMDLYAFCNTLLGNLNKLSLVDKATAQQLKEALTNCMGTVRNCVISNIRSNDRTKASGLSIYFPQFYMMEESYLATHFCKNSKWANFLSDYVEII